MPLEADLMLAPDEPGAALNTVCNKTKQNKKQVASQNHLEILRYTSAQAPSQAMKTGLLGVGFGYGYFLNGLLLTSGDSNVLYDWKTISLSL